MRRKREKTLLFTLVLSCLLLTACSGGLRPTVADGQFEIIELSQGLPQTGLWRQNLILVDTDGDGYLDIVAPPPRKAVEGQRRPFVFSFAPAENRWGESAYSFPGGFRYNYGGIAVADFNKDGFFDIALAAHDGRVVVLLNDQRGGFSGQELPASKEFTSRTVLVEDLDKDGWPDIVALSEYDMAMLKNRGLKKDKAEDKKTSSLGIMVFMNKSGAGWQPRFVEGSEGVFGDSFAVGKISATSRSDLVVAPLTTVVEERKILWAGDGTGGFRHMDLDIGGDELAYRVRVGDVDGDGLDEMVFHMSPLDSYGAESLKVFKLRGDTLNDLSKGLESFTKPLVFNLFDIDGDRQDEIILVTFEGLHILKFSGQLWHQAGFLPLQRSGVAGATDLRAGRNKDGSIIIGISLGREQSDADRGIRVFQVKMRIQ